MALEFDSKVFDQHLFDAFVVLFSQVFDLVDFGIDQKLKPESLQNMPNQPRPAFQKPQSNDVTVKEVKKGPEKEGQLHVKRLVPLFLLPLT